MSTTTDKQCILATLGGDNAQYEVLVNRYKDFVFTLCLKCLPTKEVAEEAAQDTFLKAYKSLQTFKGQSKFSTWLYRICYFTCMDYLKKNALITEDIEDSSAGQVGVEANVLEKMASDERRETITKAMSKLRAEENFVLTLYYYDDLNTDELAHVLGVTVNYAKQKLFRARKHLEKILVTEAKEMVSNYG